MLHGKTKLKVVSEAHPCAICDGDHKCSRGEDGLIVCGRTTGDVPGFVFMGKAKGDEQFALYRHVNDPALERDRRQNSQRGHNHHSNGTPKNTGNQTATGTSKNGSANNGDQKIDWAARAQKFQAALSPAERANLATALGLPECALPYLGVGWGNEYQGDHYECFWSFPERDGAGNIIGITRRYRDGKKKAMGGGNRGLFIPDNWEAVFRDLAKGLRGPEDTTAGLLYAVEGPSDTLAMTALGLPVIGRPSNTGGVDHLNDLLHRTLDRLDPDLKTVPTVVIVAEFDPKEDGKWPGREGAIKTAKELQAKMGNRARVKWSLPPHLDKGKLCKDVREWVNAQNLDPTCMDAWIETGPKLQHRFRLNDVTVSAETADGGGFTFSPIDSAALDTRDCRLVWLVKKMMVRYQPAVLAGPKKSLKTSISIDFAVSLASGTDFLGAFKVYQAVRTLVLSGESGDAVLQETARRVCIAKGINLGQIGDMLLWQFDLPKLSSDADMTELAKGLKEKQVEVVILDPLYLSLLAGQGANGLKAENLYQIGPLLLNITKACLDVGCTPILIHHTKKGSGANRDALDLDDLSYAGIAEFARQWGIISRREVYQVGSGHHALLLSVGGSAGQNGLWAVDLDEGQMSENFTGRTWNVQVRSATEAREIKADERQQAKSTKQQRQDKEDDSLVLNTLDQLDPDRVGASWNKIQTIARLTDHRMERAAYRLAVDGIIEELKVLVEINNGGKRPVRGIRRKTRDQKS